MKVFVCVDHDTHFPVGGSSIIIAQTEDRARKLLSDALKEKCLESEDFTLIEVDTEKEQAYILQDGEY